MADELVSLSALPAIDDVVDAALRLVTVIAQAQGVIMATEGVSADAAYATLLTQSRSTGRPLRERAALTLAATQTIPPSVAESD